MICAHSNMFLLRPRVLDRVFCFDFDHVESMRMFTLRIDGVYSQDQPSNSGMMRDLLIFPWVSSILCLTCRRFRHSFRPCTEFDADGSGHCEATS